MKLRQLIAIPLMGLVAWTSLSASAAPQYVFKIPLRALVNGTSPGGPTTPESPELPQASGLSLSATSYSLSAVAGQTSVQDFTLRNSGETTLSGIALTVGNTVAGLSLVNGCSGVTLAPGDSCSSQIRFTASMAGSYSAAVSASASGATASATVLASATADVSSARVVQVTTSPSSIPADGVSTLTATAIVQDAYGNNPGAGFTVVWSSNQGTLAKSIEVTGANGLSTNVLTSDRTVGTARINAAVTGTGTATKAYVEFTAP